MTSTRCDKLTKFPAIKPAFGTCGNSLIERTGARFKTVEKNKPSAQWYVTDAYRIQDINVDHQPANCEYSGCNFCSQWFKSAQRISSLNRSYCQGISSPGWTRLRFRRLIHKGVGETSLYLLIVGSATISKVTSPAYSTRHVGHSEAQQAIIRGVPDTLSKDKSLRHLQCNF